MTEQQTNNSIGISLEKILELKNELSWARYYLRYNKISECCISIAYVKEQLVDSVKQNGDSV